MNSGRFAKANELFRRGQFAEALEFYEELLRQNPGFSHYEKWRSLCRLNLEAANDGSTQVILGSTRATTHPDSRPPSLDTRRILVVTPVFNGDSHLDITIRSVVEQEGPFSIDYRVMDGCSGDQTPGILDHWLESVRAGAFELKCRGLSFSVTSRIDAGLYVAVSSGFQSMPATRARPDDILTYINADDIYVPGAFRIASTVFTSTPALWICGQIQTINTDGVVISQPAFPLSYAREDILEGLHLGDGQLYSIQQEGSFWLRSLYDAAGGLDTRLRLAADFDLWVRFARHAEVLVMDRPLASFRVRPGQLSERIHEYRQEIATTLGAHPSWANSRSSVGADDVPRFFFTENAPGLGDAQRPGPVCFLNDDLSIREIAYVRRAWFNKEGL